MAPDLRRAPKRAPRRPGAQEQGGYAAALLIQALTAPFALSLLGPAVAGTLPRTMTTAAVPKNKIGVSELLWLPKAAQPDHMDRLLDDVSAAGYEGVLFFASTLNKWLDRSDELRSHLERRGLATVGAIAPPGVDFSGVDKLCAFMAGLGGEFLVLSGRCGSEERDWAVVAPVIEHHGRLSNAHGIKTVFHHHTGWIAESMEQTERLFADTDPQLLRGMLDCGHATKDFRGRTAAEFYQRNHQRIDYVEFKDWSPETDLRTEVGRGTTDWPSVAEALREHAYTGWIVVEQNPPSDDPKTSSAESRRYIRELIGTLSTRAPIHRSG
jgi:inosose dehydratase